MIVYLICLGAMCEKSMRHSQFPCPKGSGVKAMAVTVRVCCVLCWDLPVRHRANPEAFKTRVGWEEPFLEGWRPRNMGGVLGCYASSWQVPDAVPSAPHPPPRVLGAGYACLVLVSGSSEQQKSSGLEMPLKRAPWWSGSARPDPVAVGDCLAVTEGCPEVKGKPPAELPLHSEVVELHFVFGVRLWHLPG